MKLLNALEIGLDCELTDVSESMMNIEIHAPSLFAYSELANELDEMRIDFDRLVECGGNPEMSIVDAIELMNS